MASATNTLAHRVGVTTHRSPLRHRLHRLMAEAGTDASLCLEDWLVDVANARGATVVVRDDRHDPREVAPSQEELSNEELVVAICQPHCLDRPQMLRLAAQLVSRGAVDVERLIALARAERADLVLGEMARQALRVEADHAHWQLIAHAFPPRALRSPIIHWNRLAWPRMRRHAPNAESWELVK